MPILEKDNIEAAIPSVKNLDDYRTRHYYDNNKDIGTAIADSVGWKGKIAWDIYLFYSRSAVWSEKPPPPVYWMHQLTDDWATKDRYRTGDDLKIELSSSTEKILLC